MDNQFDNGVRKESHIYRKPDLSDYQQEVNAAICLRTPCMICKRGTLLELACKEVHDSGYVYKKGNLVPKRLAHVKTHQKGENLIATIDSKG